MATPTHRFEPDADHEKTCGYRPHNGQPICGFPASNARVHAPGALPGPRLAAVPSIRTDSASIAAGAPDTSVAAAAVTKPRRGEVRWGIVELLHHPSRQTHGWTCDEIERERRWAHTTTSSAITGLKRDGYITAALDDEGRTVTRPTAASGSPATVYVVTEAGRAALRAERRGVAS